MSRKYSWLALAAMFAVFGILALGDSPVNHRVMLGSLYTAGEMELHPGEYVIAIHSHGPTVQITELSTGESQFVLAVVERSLQTFERTEVVSRRGRNQPHNGDPPWGHDIQNSFRVVTP